jgi:hypothetical protein
MALENKLIIRFTRPLESGFVLGYVLDIGPHFFLVAIVDSGIRFDGFKCFRLSDVRELEMPYKYTAFTEGAIKKRGERLPTKPRVSLASLEELLLSASKAFGLVTIHRERVDPDVCWIGRVVGISKGRVNLIEIDPDAHWSKKPKTYRLSEITHVDFGGDYEKALQLVGGEAPTLT